jgi:hypothetical protein
MSYCIEVTGARDDKGYGVQAVTRGELLALRHLVECLTRVVQNSPLTAEYVEAHAVAAAEALEIIEEES